MKTEYLDLRRGPSRSLTCSPVTTESGTSKLDVMGDKASQLSWGLPVGDLHCHAVEFLGCFVLCFCADYRVGSGPIT